MAGIERRRIRVDASAAVVAIAVVALVVGACGGATDAPPSTASVETAPTSSSAPPAPTDLIPKLLALDDVRPIAAFGLDIREQPVLDPQQFALATLRGPCGATIETPFAEAGVFRVFRSTVSLIIEAVAQPGADEAAAFVDLLRVDAQPGCPPFAEQLGSAEASTIELQEMLDLSSLGDEWIGWTQEVTASTGRVGFRTILVAAEGDRLWLLAVLSPDPIAADQLVGLGKLASERAAAG